MIGIEIKEELRKNLVPNFFHENLENVQNYRIPHQ